MPDLTLFMAGLGGGGAERVMLYLARGFVDRGLKVDLVLVKTEGPSISLIPPEVRVVNLGTGRLLRSIPALVRYLKQNKPKALLSAMEDINVVALWCRWLAGVSTRVVVSVHNTLSVESKTSNQIKKRFAPYLARLFYPSADVVVTVSQGAAVDLVNLGLSKESVKVIYNPVVTPELLKKAAEPVDHPWFSPGELPVILAVGRLDKQKDFSTLIRAFAQVKRQSSARLMILGEGPERSGLEALVGELNLGESVALPGFVSNPYSYMKQAAVFVLSSLYEGLPTVLIEAIAVGTSVVSTDCKSGPAEILENGRYGKLVTVGDVSGMAEAIISTLEHPLDSALLQEKATQFLLEKAVEHYLQVLNVG